jgi:hypothetical protein
VRWSTCSFQVRDILPYDRLPTDSILDNVTNIPTSDPKQPIPSHLFFTSTGKIGVISEVGGDAKEKTALNMRLTELQRNLASVVKGAGEVEHTE